MFSLSASARPEVPVPPVERESRTWRVQQPEIFSRNEVRRQTGSYESTIPPEIAHVAISLPGELAADVDEAARAIVDFDTEAPRRLGVESPALGPMSSILLRTESASSSQIEQLTTSAKQLALAELGEAGTPNAAIVLGNVRAMEAALELADAISIDAIRRMHEALLAPSRMPEHAGRFREEAVWIGGDNAGPIGADFIAPHHDRVRAAVDDVVEFARRTDLPALVHVAIAHAQFETIHPFVDGNGRTGRALAQAMIRHLQLARHTTVPISAGLLIDTESYFAALSAYREGDAGPIVRRFADAARFAVVSGRELVDDLARELERSREAMAGIRRQSAVWTILPTLIQQPIVNLRYLRTQIGTADATTLRALDALTEHGVLTERTSGRRNRVWECRGILEALEEYARRIRRART